MTDIVERLRDYEGSLAGNTCKEAADEIERLRDVNQQLPTDIVWLEIGRLRQQNAELLAALEEIAENGWAVEAKIARAAIEKAKT